MSDIASDPVTNEVVRSALTYACEEMGIALRNAAYSPNIKERLDHSCALFDRRGRMIAQAEHIPVHLGSLPWGLHETLRAIAARGERVEPGEQWVVNDPYVAGTHLNDVTLIRPVFAGDGSTARLVGYAANKAHHTDVGGKVPGSISTDARELCEEGLILPPLRLVRGDALVAEIVALVRANSRTPAARSGDLTAQVAANVIGERRVLEVLERYGESVFEAAIEASLDASDVLLQAALRRLGDGEARVEEVIEPPDGGDLLRLVARVRLAGGAMSVDYAGTHAQVPSPLNAVFGVTLSGVHYALRCMTGDDIPMNEGCFRAVTVSAPEGCLLNPRRPAPVGGGNVETSQRNADLLFRAFAELAPGRVPAQSAGTMANVMAGGERAGGVIWALYETIGGGMGARPGADGIDGIHTHMTNTLNTPVEALERSAPIRVTRYEFAEGSGGDGEFRGGCGLVRGFTLTEGTATFSLLAERHRVAPEGAAGGKPGARGAHALRRAGGEAESLPAKCSVELRAGDEIVVQTPGGGGYGAPARRNAD